MQSDMDSQTEPCSGRWGSQESGSRAGTTSDCLIFASGFEVGTRYARRSGYETVGRDGITLPDHWTDGMRTLHGIHVNGFPILFPSSSARLRT